MRENMDMEKECTQLGALFHSIVTDLKSSAPAWDDFVNKGTKLHNLLKSTSIAASAFVESIQKIADMATNTKGSTKDIGSALTRMCVRQKMMENKLKVFTNALMDNLVCPVQDRLEEWKKVANQLEKDHTKDYKRAMHEIKKRNSDTLRLQKKVRKGSKPDVQNQLSSVMRDVNDRLSVLQEAEKSALRNLLIEERSRICLFTNSLSPVLDLQVSMLNVVTNLQELTSDAMKLCRNPKQLPTSTEQLVQDFISVNNSNPSSPLEVVQMNGFLNTTNSPPPSPTSSDSKRSSLCSVNSLTSSDSRSSGSLNRSSSMHHRHYQGYHPRTSSSSNPGQSSPTSCQSAPGGAVARLSSASSHDSGFVSTGNGPLPLNLASLVGAEQVAKQQLDKADRGDDVISAGSPVIRSRSNSEQLPDSMAPSIAQNKPFSWKDWSRPGPYDLPAPPPQAIHDPRRNVLPSKSAPLPLTPKPTKGSHRLSADLTNENRRHPPLYHANTTPCFFPVLPPKEDNALPPPPEAGNNLGFSGVHCSEDLPPPPPTLLEDGTSPQPDDLPPFPTSGNPLTRRHSAMNGFPPKEFPRENPVRYIPPSQEMHSMTLGRKGSCNSLQYSNSSGYGSQNTTPACSEDAISSYDPDFSFAEYDEPHHRHVYEQEKFSTLPRNYLHGNGTAPKTRGNRTRRPLSTVEIPSSRMIATQIDSGTATIRRKPTSKFNSVRRTTSGPKAVQTPTIPNNNLANLMSTFAPPSQYANINGNNSADRSGDFPAFHGVEEPDFPQQKHSMSRNLSLQFQPSSGAGDDSPTPTMSLTTTDYVQSYGVTSHISSHD